uniref:Uncharacterized protein n=1 Tax=Setaria italica TaxID=4555 RepID=K4ANV6_SETIT
MGLSGGVAHTAAAAIERGEERTTCGGRRIGEGLARIGEGQAQIGRRHLGSGDGWAAALEASSSLLQPRCESVGG